MSRNTRNSHSEGFGICVEPFRGINSLSYLAYCPPTPVPLSPYRWYRLDMKDGESEKKLTYVGPKAKEAR